MSSEQDHFGETALDYAVARGYDDMQTLLLGPIIPTEKTRSSLWTTFNKKGLLEFLPPLYEAPGGGNSDDGNTALLRFIISSF